MAFKDYTLATKVDPNSRFAVTANKITVTGMQRDEDAYIYFDEGVDFFDGDFTRQNSSKMETTTQDTAIASIWCVANVIDDINGLDIGGGSALAAISGKQSGGTGYFSLYEIDSGARYTDAYVAAAVTGTQYWHEFERDETVGIYGTMYWRIYSDSGRTVLVDTLVITLHTSKKDYRYEYGIQSYNSATTPAWDGFVENLTNGEIVIVAFNHISSSIYDKQFNAFKELSGKNTIV